MESKETLRGASEGPSCASDPAFDARARQASEAQQCGNKDTLCEPQVVRDLRRRRVELQGRMARAQQQLSIVELMLDAFGS